jgi:predicted SprT family Zn-dependent metalloprotease
MLRINRIGINLDVPLDELPKILAHELVHVHQKHKGTLRIKHNGNCYWHGILITTSLPEDMSYENYMNLPWEMDAYDKQTKVLQQALYILTTNN